jgi:predicted acetyltransferase
VSIEIRATEPHEIRSVVNTLTNALLDGRPDDARFERSLPSWDGMPSFSAWDGDRCVGHGGQFLVDTTVPGGRRVPTGAVSRVGVLATHRRRGIATGLMEALTRDAAERGLALMSLRASEATIYGRFGFGVAGEYCRTRLDAGRASPIRGAEPAGSFRLLEPSELVDVLPDLYDRVAHRRVGAITRPSSWWSRYLREAIEQTKASFVAVHTDRSGVDDGYVHYDVRWHEDDDGYPTGLGDVHDLFAASEAVELALWQYLCDVDLVTTWSAEGRPVDDLVRLAVHDPRAHRIVTVLDEQWLRIVDVAAALAARSYRPTTGAVTIAVTDRLLPRNDGTWRISASGVEPTDDRPDLAVGIETLSAAYLGGPSWVALAGVGAVEVHRADAIEVADTLFATRPLPVCSSFF